MVYDLLNPDSFDLYGEDNEFLDSVEVSAVSPASLRAWTVSGRLVTNLAVDVMEHSTGKYVVVCAYGVFGSYPHSVSYLGMFDRIWDALEHVCTCTELSRHVFHSGVEYEVWYVSPREEWTRYEREVEYAKPNACYVLDCPCARLVLKNRSDFDKLLGFTHCAVGVVKSEVIPSVTVYPERVPVERHALVAIPSCRWLNDAACETVFIEDVDKWAAQYVNPDNFVFEYCIPF